MPLARCPAEELVPNQPTLQYPPLTLQNVSGIASKDYIKNHFAKGKRVFWGKVECGLILPSLSSWEMVTKQKGVTAGGYMREYCKGFWKQGRGGSRFLQIIGRHKKRPNSLVLTGRSRPLQCCRQPAWCCGRGMRSRHEGVLPRETISTPDPGSN